MIRDAGISEMVTKLYCIMELVSHLQSEPSLILQLTLILLVVKPKVSCF